MAGDVTLGDLLRFKAAIAPQYGFAVDATATTHTLTGAQVVGAVSPATSLPNTILGPDEVTVDLTGTLGSAQNIQMPTAAAILAAMPNAYVGQKFKLIIKNDSGGAFAWTVTTNTGVTLTGTMTIAQNTLREFYITVNGLGANAAIGVQNAGGGTA